MSNLNLTDLVAIGAGVIGLLLYVTLILVPAWGSYARLWERLTAAALSLYVLGVLVGAGVFGALLAVYLWG
jgi:O-antigen ligase